mmetsp:Transcript_44163/g.106931  ORF Transcript_44163/g.106931 Transcript_44163/m.106931 type:complete len:148 (+) Transcript_44163:134-577(+)
MPKTKNLNGEDDKFVYVVTLVTVDHAVRYSSSDNPERKIVGVYSTKAAAVSEAGTVDTNSYGPFDEAIKEEDFEDDHVDNRENPPNKGILLQIGDEHSGEGDYVQLHIEKFPIKDGSSTRGSSKNQPTPAAKKQKKELTAGDLFGRY